MKKKIASFLLVSTLLLGCASTGGLTPTGEALVKTLVETAVTVAYLEAPEARIALNTICTLKSDNTQDKIAKIKELLSKVWTASNTESAFIAATAINGIMTMIDGMVKEKVSDDEIAIFIDEIVVDVCASINNVNGAK